MVGDGRFEPEMETKKPLAGQVFFELVLVTARSGKELPVRKDEVKLSDGTSNYAPFDWFADYGVAKRRDRTQWFGNGTVINMSFELPEETAKEAASLQLKVLDVVLGDLGALGLKYRYLPHRSTALVRICSFGAARRRRCIPIPSAAANQRGSPPGQVENLVVNSKQGMRHWR